MGNNHKKVDKTTTLNTSVIELAIRLALLSLLVFWSFEIIRPFIGIIAGSVILSVALYPIFVQFTKWLGGRRLLAAALITFLNLLIFIGPTTWLGLGLVDVLQTLYDKLETGTIQIPRPAESVKDWPLIGEQLFIFWNLASTNLKTAIVQVAPQLKPLGSVLLGMARSIGSGMLYFLASVILAGFFLTRGSLLVEGITVFLRRLMSKRGEQFVQLAGATIRSVSQGVIGISLLQALLAGIGLMVAQVPGAGLIAFCVLILGIIQIGPALILIPVIIWAWFTMDTTTALIFTIYMVPVNALDNVLKPIVMSRGLTTPMPIIFLGVLGGTVSHGLVGLFVGPIVLAVAWDLFITWVRDDETNSN